jgi:hypothetical protein
MSLKNVSNCLITDVIAQLAYFALELAIAPVRLLAHEADDQRFDLSLAAPRPPR